MLLLFLGAVWSHWIAKLGILLSLTPLVPDKWRQFVEEKLIKREFSLKHLWIVVMLFLSIAVYQAWEDEHRNTQAVIAEKAAEVSAKNSCITDYRVQQAYAQGLRSMGDSARQSLDAQQVLNSSQQAAINSCVISLGKMNPLINAQTKVVPIFVGEVSPGKYGFLVIVTTNHASIPIGRVSCENTFTAVSPAGLPFVPRSAGGVHLADMSPPASVNEREIEIRLPSSEGDWDSNNPIFFRAISHSRELGSCMFKPPK